MHELLLKILQTFYEIARYKKIIISVLPQIDPDKSKSYAFRIEIPAKNYATAVYITEDLLKEEDVGFAILHILEQIKWKLYGQN